MRETENDDDTTGDRWEGDCAIRATCGGIERYGR